MKKLLKIHIPDEYESKRLQEYCFSIGITWHNGKNHHIDLGALWSRTPHENMCLVVEGTIFHYSQIDHPDYVDEKFCTVDEFIKINQNLKGESK